MTREEWALEAFRSIMADPHGRGEIARAGKELQITAEDAIAHAVYDIADAMMRECERRTCEREKAAQSSWTKGTYAEVS